MNATLKNIVIFALGMGTGALISYKRLKDKYEAIAQEEIESVVETFSRRAGYSGEEPLEETNGMTDAQYMSLHYRRPKTERVAYDKVIPPKEEQPSEPVPPYVITFEEFGALPETETQTITYYDNDDTLADTGDEIITDPDAVVGLDALTRFGDGSEDPDVVYVRNEKLGIDYEIVRVRKSYAEEVYGLPPKDPRPIIRKKGKHDKGEEREQE